MVTLNKTERQNGPYFALFLPNLLVSGAHCLKVVNKAITMGNLQLLSTSKRLQRHRATPPVCYITARWKFCRLADAKIQDFMRSTRLSIV